jgi:hypothetical protein
MNTQAPDFAALARQLGLDAAVYPVKDAFRHLGVGESLGWDLINQGMLRAIRLTAKKTVITAESIARLLHECEQCPPPSSQADRVTQAQKSRRA